MVDRRRAWLVLTSLVATFVLMRIALTLSPNSDFDLAGYNIHHLFVGLLLIVAGGVPLAVMTGRSPWIDAASITFGSGLALALDEWVYLIATDGSNASYLRPVSFWGGVIVVGLACVYLAALLLAGSASTARTWEQSNLRGKNDGGNGPPRP
jgi:uncharacterized membrane protein